MSYSAIDGDVSDFIDAQLEVTTVFRTEELRNYLISAGHPLATTIAAITEWQQERFSQLDPSWETFSLTAAGTKAVEELRDRID